MSTLRSVIEELPSDPEELTDVEVEDELVETARAMDLLQARFLRFTAAVDRRRTYARDGVLSTSRFLAVACGLDDSTARERVATARTLTGMPATRAGFEGGDLPYAKVRVLAHAAAAHPDTFLAHEDTLLDVAFRLPVSGLRRAVAYWRHQLDGPARMADMIDRSYLHASPTLQGMVRVDGLLDPEAGETLITALAAATPPPPAGEHAPASRRRAQALTRLCRTYLDHPDGAAGRPHLNVLVDLETLEGRAGWVCELTHTGTIPPETARRLACDARVSRIVSKGRSQPLEVGRTTRTVTKAQRRAVVVRDRHCRFPNCDRPPTWSDVHHIVHWADGGPTDLDNLILVCRRHHTLVHEHGFRLTGTARDPTFTRPNGTTL